jgi:nucleotide-binding universal stress UspA family protein
MFLRAGELESDLAGHFRSVEIDRTSSDHAGSRPALIEINNRDRGRWHAARRNRRADPMTIRDLIVYVDENAADDAAIDIAAALAGRDGAQLTGIFPVPPMRIPAAYEPIMFEPLWQQWREDCDVAAVRCRQRYEGRLQAAGIDGGWLVASGGPDAAMLHARYVDLAVVARGKADIPAGMAVSAEELAIDGGRPVLMVPPGSPPTVGRNAVVAWKPTREAVRAVNEALPVLEPGAKVTVLVVDPQDSPEHGEEPGADIAAHLARHGMQVTVEVAQSGHLDVTGTLLRRAAELGADLVVMGAYGHSRLRERILGGVTRDLLRTAPLPVLIAH